MLQKSLALWVVLSLAGPAVAQSSASAPDVAHQADAIVATYRQIIVLTADDTALDDVHREHVSILGRILFQQNQDRLMALSAALAVDPKRQSIFLDRLEKSPEYHDADKLVFRELLEDLAEALPSGPEAGPLRQRIADDRAALEQIQAMYQEELAAVFDRFQTRGMPIRREAWQKYLDFIQQKYSREKLLNDYRNLLPEDTTRGGGKEPKKSSADIYGTELPPKTLLLTFDDGPHPRYTDQILDILKAHNLQAVFFEVGRNVGTIGAADAIKLTKSAQASYRILAEGSALGNHSYTHPLLPKLTPAKYTDEIASTNTLLKYVLNADPVLFRPPYGASNAGIQQVVTSDKMKSMIWNIDSMDWADPVPNSVAQRVLRQVEHEGRGIILFHDIHKRAIEVLPDLIATLEKNGYRFASWNGNGFSVNDTRGVQTVALPQTGGPPYRESWAAVIGIDSYHKWPKLQYAAHDANGVRDMLVQKYKFKPQNVFMLLDEDATREKILSLLGDKLADPQMVDKDDRVLVFFAGHGATRKLASGRDLGYIIPVDADLANFEGQAISMSNFQDIAEAIPAKHLLFVMDSCYSGLALTRGGPMGASTNYLQEIARREARQMFTAGGADEQVADNGPNGHSVFTWTLLQGLDGRADLNGDGVITATELAAYVAPAVSSLSHQTPAFGNLPGSQGGDFIFELKHDVEFLNEDSTQLGDDAIRMNAAMEKLRAENQALQKQLAAAQKELRQSRSAEPAGPPSPVEQALALNDQGMRLYKEKRYPEALAKFVEGATADPANAQLSNNAGFVLFKTQKYSDSLVWFQKAIASDPNRAVAYLNLGDACAKLRRTADARQNYQKFLELAPNSKSALEVKAKMAALAP
jgi:peptidoglycan/xylan/chitin deacetylase (PgdA/CDA1 family)/tetratricopeptide (TPR) repeat protein